MTQKLLNPGFDSNLSRLINKMSELPPEKYVSWSLVTENGTSINIDYNKATSEVIIVFKNRGEYRENNLYMNGSDAFKFRRMWDAVVEESRLGPKDEKRNDLLTLVHNQRAEVSYDPSDDLGELQREVLDYFEGDKG